MATTIRTRILSVERRESSRNGNPRYQVETEYGVYLTAVDSACAYGIGNRENMTPNLVDVTLERNQVIYVEPVTPTAVQTEEVRIGDVFKDWHDGKPARVTKIQVRKFNGTVFLSVEPTRRGDIVPSHRSLKYGRTVTVIRS